jgi:hypothetical protein
VRKVSAARTANSRQNHCGIQFLAIGTTKTQPPCSNLAQLRPAQVRAVPLEFADLGLLRLGQGGARRAVLVIGARSGSRLLACLVTRWAQIERANCNARRVRGMVSVKGRRPYAVWPNAIFDCCTFLPRQLCSSRNLRGQIRDLCRACHWRAIGLPLCAQERRFQHLRSDHELAMKLPLGVPSTCNNSRQPRAELEVGFAVVVFPIAHTSKATPPATGSTPMKQRHAARRYRRPPCRRSPRHRAATRSPRPWAVRRPRHSRA